MIIHNGNFVLVASFSDTEIGIEAKLGHVGDNWILIHRDTDADQLIGRTEGPKAAVSAQFEKIKNAA